MTARWPVLTDDLLRAVLTESPPAGLTDVVLDELKAMIDQTPQRRRARMLWPWSPALPSARSATKRSRHLDTAAALGVLVLVLGAALAAIVLVGSVSRVRPLGSSGLIAFAAGGEIWVANPDGTGPRQLTIDAQRDGEPIFSPDGRRIAYQSLDAATSTISLVVMDPDGTRRVTVATLPANHDYSSVDAMPWYIVAWSPDERRFAYAAPVGGAQQLFVVDAGGGVPRQIGDPALQSRDPVWSPDGTRIAFIGGRSNDDRGVYVMGADGTAPRRLGPMPGRWASEFGIPSWSPDGESLAFSARIEWRSRVFVDALDGTGPRVVSGDDEQENVSAAWSPDGRRLAWMTSPTGESWRFVVAAIDGSGSSVLSPTVHGGPEWSPDGTTLLGYRMNFTAGRMDPFVLVKVADGSVSEVQGQPESGASWQWLAP